MLRNFLLPESIARADGTGPEIDLGSKRGKLLVLTLGITRILEQESLEVTVWGSRTANAGTPSPWPSFPPSFIAVSIPYC